MSFWVTPLQHQDVTQVAANGRPVDVHDVPYVYLKGGIRDEDDAGTSTCHPRAIHWKALTDVPYDVP